MAPPKRKKTNRGQAAFVREYLVKHAGEEIFLNDLYEEAVARGFAWTERQIQTAVQNLLTRMRMQGQEPDIQVVTRGNSWRYVGHLQSHEKEVDVSKLVFEEIGTTRDGQYVLQDNNGGLWLAHQL